MYNLLGHGTQQRVWIKLKKAFTNKNKRNRYFILIGPMKLPHYSTPKKIINIYTYDAKFILYLKTTIHTIVDK